MFQRFAQVYLGGPSSGQADPSGQGLTKDMKRLNDNKSCANNKLCNGNNTYISYSWCGRGNWQMTNETSLAGRNHHVISHTVIPSFIGWISLSQARSTKASPWNCRFKPAESAPTVNTRSSGADSVPTWIFHQMINIDRGFWVHLSSGDAFGKMKLGLASSSLRLVAYSVHLKARARHRRFSQLILIFFRRSHTSLKSFLLHHSMTMYDWCGISGTCMNRGGRVATKRTPQWLTDFEHPRSFQHL